MRGLVTLDLEVYEFEVVKEIEDGHVKEMKKLEWWFEQDIDDEEEEDEEGEGGKCQLEDVGRRVKVAEKEADLKVLFPPVGDPISPGGPKYIGGLPGIYEGRFLEK
nr:hypothetical protein [Tanacetum cinerariifolium]